MDLREAADILGVHYRTACAWVREAPRLIHVRDWVAQAQAPYPAITGGQETRARHQVDRLASGVRHIDLCEQVIAPALRRLGDVLLTTPLIGSLRRAWRQATSDALFFADTAGILEDNPDLNGVVTMPARPSAGQSLALAARQDGRAAAATRCSRGSAASSGSMPGSRSRSGAPRPGSTPPPTTGAPTARSTCPRCWAPTSGAARSSPRGLASLEPVAHAAHRGDVRGRLGVLLDE